MCVPEITLWEMPVQVAERYPQSKNLKSEMLLCSKSLEYHHEATSWKILVILFHIYMYVCIWDGALRSLRQPNCYVVEDDFEFPILYALACLVWTDLGWEPGLHACSAGTLYRLSYNPPAFNFNWRQLTHNQMAMLTHVRFEFTDVIIDHV